MAASNSRVLRWTPRRICFSVSSANHRSTRFSHDAPVGVKWRWKREAGPLCQPPADQRRLVCPVVVEDEVDGEVRRHHALDRVEELPELDTAMAPMTLPHDGAGLHIECRKQRRGAMPAIIMRPPLHLPGP